MSGKPYPIKSKQASRLKRLNYYKKEKVKKHGLEIGLSSYFYQKSEEKGK